MRQLSAIIHQGLDQVRESRPLQLGWELALGTCLTGTLLLSARLLGSFQPDPDVVRAIGSVWLVNGAALLLTWWLSERSIQTFAKPLPHIFLWSNLLFLGSFLVSLSLLPAGSTLAALTCLSASLLHGVLHGRLLLSRSEQTFAMPEESPISPPHQEKSAPDLTAEVVFEPVLEATSVDSFSRSKNESEQLIQWLTRKQEEDGTEVIEGMIRLELAVGQTQKSAHVAFTPALASTPEMECEPLGEWEVEAILGDVYPHGFRVDLRRTGDASLPQQIEIGFHAASGGNQRNAA